MPRSEAEIEAAPITANLARNRGGTDGRPYYDPRLRPTARGLSRAIAGTLATTFPEVRPRYNMPAPRLEGGLTYRPGVDRAPAQPLSQGHSQAREDQRVDPTSRAPCGAGFAKVWCEGVRANLLAGVTLSEATIVDAAAARGVEVVGGAGGRGARQHPGVPTPALPRPPRRSAKQPG
jgi:hypothetical protein